MTPLKTEPQNQSLQPSSQKAARLLHALRQNPAYYLENLLRIETKAGTLEPFKPNDQQLFILNLVSALRELNLPVKLIILKARQIGMSTLGAALLFHATSLWPHRHSKVVAHDLDTTELLFDKSKLFYSKLPEEPLLRPPTEKYGRKGIIFAAPLHSRITLTTAGNDEVGTGATIQNLHGSELSKWEHPHKVMTSVMQTIPPPSVNPNTMVIFESTANGYGDSFHELYLGAKENKEQLIKDLHDNWNDRAKIKELLASHPRDLEFIPVFFPWHEFKEYTDAIPDEKWFKGSLTPEELELKARYKLTIGQLAFRRRKIRELANNEAAKPEDLFRQEYPSNDIEAFLATGQNYFSATELQKMKPGSPVYKGRLIETQQFDYEKYKVSHTDPETGKYVPEMQEDPYGELTVWQKPEEYHQYAIGVDVAMGERDNNDYSVIEVFDKETGLQVAEWWGRVHPDILARYAVQLGAWYNEAIVAIERNGLGVAAVTSLQNTLYSFPYIQNSSNFAVIQEAPTEMWGWPTTQVTKPQIINDMAKLIRDREVKFQSQKLLHEALAFRQEGTKFAAPEGKHDDCVMAVAICLRVMLEHPYQKEMMPGAIPLADRREMEQSAELQTEDWDPEFEEVSLNEA